MDLCPHISRIGAYEDGELSEQDHARIEQHLAQCSQCASELKAIRELSRLVGDLSQPQVSGDFVERLHAQVDSLTDRSVLRFAQALSGVAAAVLVAASMLMGRADGTRTEPLPWERAAVESRPPTPAQFNSLQTAQWIAMQLSPEQTHE